MLSQEHLANRRRFINALRANTAGYKQITGSLFNKTPQGEVCALGMGVDEFGLKAYGDTDVYSQLAALFGLSDYGQETDPKGIRYVYHLNDKEKLTFNQIADRLAMVWQLY
jgi:hypothetical protein